MLDYLIAFGPLLLIPLFMGIDLLHRARDYQRPRFWRTRATLVSLVAVGLSVGAGFAWAEVLTFPSLFDLSGWGMLGGAAAGIFAYQLVLYWYHRAAHKFTWLWRATHQMHHSAESLDAFGAYYFSPLDILSLTSVNILVFYPLLGLSPGAGALGALVLTFLGVLQHANIRTPRWLGYFIQRPESHSIHHARGVHGYNYADLPVFDMLFGTFRNPAKFTPQVGFYDGASARIPGMLAMQDVATPPEREATLEAEPVPQRLAA